MDIKTQWHIQKFQTARKSKMNKQKINNYVLGSKQVVNNEM